MILSNGSSGMYIQEAITTRCIYRFYKCVFTSIRYSKYVYTGISSSGMYIQASDIQDMYIQVSVLLVSIYRYHVLRYVYTGIRYSNMYVQVAAFNMHIQEAGHEKMYSQIFTGMYIQVSDPKVCINRYQVL